MLKAGSAARRLSLAFDPPQPASTFAERVTAFLRAVDHTLQQHNAMWVGHCKLLVAAYEHVAYASITVADDAIHWSAALPATLTHAELTVYAAIYNLSDVAVAQALDANLALLENQA